jgi:hypothetical protein
MQWLFDILVSLMKSLMQWLFDILVSLMKSLMHWFIRHIGVSFKSCKCHCLFNIQINFWICISWFSMVMIFMYRGVIPSTSRYDLFA